MEKLELRIEKEFVKGYGIASNRVKVLGEFLQTIHDFIQYLGTNQYYSDAVNKKIFLLGLDLDAAVLRLQALGLELGSMRDAIEKSVLGSQKERLDEKRVSDFKARLSDCEKEISALYERALALTEEIRSDYRRKQ